MAKKTARAEREARIQHLRNRCQGMSDERSRLEAINEEEDAAPWIGACFKYRNLDSSGNAWWLYVRVVAHERAGSFKTVQCQSQSGGWHIVTTQDHVYLLPDPKARGYVRITRRQFDAAWRKFVTRIADMNTED